MSWRIRHLRGKQTRQNYTPHPKGDEKGAHDAFYLADFRSCPIREQANNPHEAEPNNSAHDPLLVLNEEAPHANPLAAAKSPRRPTRDGDENVAEEFEFNLAEFFHSINPSKSFWKIVSACQPPVA